MTGLYNEQKLRRFTSTVSNCEEQALSIQFENRRAPHILKHILQQCFVSSPTVNIWIAEMAVWTVLVILTLYPAVFHNILTDTGMSVSYLKYCLTVRVILSIFKIV